MKPLLTGVVPHCGHHSSQEQRGKFWMTKDVRTRSRKTRSAPILSPDCKVIIVAQPNDQKKPQTQPTEQHPPPKVFQWYLELLQSCRLMALLSLSQDSTDSNYQGPFERLHCVSPSLKRTCCFPVASVSSRALWLSSPHLPTLDAGVTGFWPLLSRLPLPCSFCVSLLTASFRVGCLSC